MAMSLICRDEVVVVPVNVTVPAARVCPAVTLGRLEETV